MQFHITEAGPVSTMVITGRLDLVGSEAIALPLATLSGSKKDLVIDMAGVSFIASIGLRHFVSASKAVRRKGGQLVLLNPNDVVAEVITTSGLTDLLPIERRA
jgi:anti-sigma B factor antagonist